MQSSHNRPPHQRKWNQFLFYFRKAAQKRATKNKKCNEKSDFCLLLYAECETIVQFVSNLIFIDFHFNVLYVGCCCCSIPTILLRFFTFFFRSLAFFSSLFGSVCFCLKEAKKCTSLRCLNLDCKKRCIFYEIHLKYVFRIAYAGWASLLCQCLHDDVTTMT